MTATNARRPFPAWAPPLLLVLLLAATLASVLLLARRAAEPDTPPPPAPFAPPAPARPITALDVQQAAEGRLTLSDGSRDLAPRSDARVEALRPCTAAGIRTGDWLAAIGIPNEVRNFSIRSLVLIADPGPPDAAGVVRSPGGFAGHEASRDQAERPLLGGVVTAVDGNRVTLQGPTGPMVVNLTPSAPLRRLEEARADEIREGDRIAYRADAGAFGEAPALLVLPGGAR